MTLVSLNAAVASAIDRYTIIDLGTLGGTSSFGRAINASGQIVGGADLLGDTQTHAFLYADNVMVDLGTLGGFYTEALALNNSGEIVGCSYLSDDTTRHAFVVSSGRMHDLNDYLARTPPVGSCRRPGGSTTAAGSWGSARTLMAMCVLFSPKRSLSQEQRCCS